MLTHRLICHQINRSGTSSTQSIYITPYRPILFQPAGLRLAHTLSCLDLYPLFTVVDAIFFSEDGHALP